MNNFAELSNVDRAEGESDTFLVRWRGRQEGPYPASVIEAKLEANAIGLLHEILHRGKWITIRDYITEKETALRLEQQAREEQERREREEAQRKAREQEDRRQAEILAEGKLRTEQIEINRLRQQQNQEPQNSASKANRETSSLYGLGALLLVAGCAVVGYFFFVFDPSVESGVGRVNNLGLMADRQNGIIIGIGLGVAGTIMLAIGSRGKS